MFCKYRVTIGMLTVLVLLRCVQVSSAQHLAAKSDTVLADLDVRISSFLEGVSLGQTQGT